MTAGVTATIRAALRGVLTGANDLADPTIAFGDKTTWSDEIAPGTSTGQANKMFSDERQIAAGSSENLDLAGGLSDPFGVALTFTKIKAIMVIADAANDGLISIGGAASNAFVGPFADATDIVKLAAGEMLLITNLGAGWTVTASTGDILKVANSGAAQGSYKIVLIGVG